MAVVGASPRPGSFGEQMMIQLLGGGFTGAVYPVNPRHTSVLGLVCHPSLAEVPEPVDLAILGVPNAALESQLLAAARAGARSAVIFASCYEAPVRGQPPLAARLATISRDHGMALCGGNGMGFVNLERPLRACGFSEPLDLEPGPIAFLSHSGSAFSAMLHNDRGLRFNLVVSMGMELATTAAGYLHHALDLASTKAVGLFLEAVREPDSFRAALDGASARDVPVVALKVGRSGRARELVTAHSGALAGEDGAYEALFDAHGVLRVDTLDELCDTLELMVAGRRAGPGALAAIHDSGGERAHLVDAADDAGVTFADLSEATRERLRLVLEDGLPAVNPLDAWGTGNDADRIFAECMGALIEDEHVAALAFCVDLTTEPVPDAGYARVATEVFAQTTKPMAVLSNLASAVDRRDAAILRAAGIPVLEGTASGLAAFRHLFAYRDFRAREPVRSALRPAASVRSAWQGRLRRGGQLGEIEALELLAAYGIPVVRTEPVSSAEEAVAAAERIGWPVALKTAAPGVLHKSDVAGVALGLGDPEALRRAYRDIEARLGPSAVVAEMAWGVELALGMVRDAQFGPIVMVAAGGVLIEVLRDRAFALPPLDPSRARAMLDRLAVRPLLEGVRGGPAADLDGVAEAVVRLSVLAEDLGHLIESLDVNPLMAGPGGCVAVDAMVIPAAAPRLGPS